MVACRVGFVLLTLVFIFAILRTTKVRVFDRIVSGWIFLTLLILLLFNFTRPANYLTTAFDIIFPFAIYTLSPLKLIYNVALAVGFSTGTLYVDYAFKSGVDPILLNTATAAQLIVHALGLGSALQIQTYRRMSFRAYIQEKDARESVAYLANIDPLTESLTRRQFFSMLNTEFLRFARYRRPLSILVVDVDHFKEINDTYGHHTGDVVLKSLSLVILEQKRTQDTFGRLGGEEFGLLLPETNLGQARIVAERIQRTWDKTPTNMDSELIPSTVSIGVAEAHSDDKSFEDILRRADRMMYKAKESGRNCVVAE
jgi:diguanylate cyclase (GGDEF)-like protein